MYAARPQLSHFGIFVQDLDLMSRCMPPRSGNRIELYVHTPWYVPQPLREPLDLSQDDDIVRARTAWQAQFRHPLAARLLTS